MVSSYHEIVADLATEPDYESALKSLFRVLIYKQLFITIHDFLKQDINLRTPVTHING